VRPGGPSVYISRRSEVMTLGASGGIGREIELGGLRCRVLGGGEGGPVAILLHGFGAPGTDLVSLARVLRAPPGTRFVFPEAPLAMPPEYAGGRAWWMIDMIRLQVEMMRGELRDLTREVPEGLAPAAGLVVAVL